MATPGPRRSLFLNSYASLVSTFADFLTVAIHTILYERGIYPASTFISTRKYNFPVRQNRHPKVCQWILDAVTAVEVELLKGTVARVAVVLYAPEAAKSTVLERFMFDVSGFPSVDSGDAFTLFGVPGVDGNADDVEVGEEDRVSLVDIEEQLRATVRKLAFCGSRLGPLPQGCTFTLAVELRDKAKPPIGHPQPWVPSVPSLQTGKKGASSRIGTDLGGVKSMPVRVVEAGRFILDAWVEEGKAKQKLST